jgi:hypothetical protein
MLPPSSVFWVVTPCSGVVGYRTDVSEFCATIFRVIFSFEAFAAVKIQIEVFGL